MSFSPTLRDTFSSDRSSPASVRPVAWRPAASRGAWATALGVVLLGAGALGCSSEEVTPIALEPTEPVVEEHVPKKLEILAPERAAFISAADGTKIVVSGRGAAAGLTINGEPVDVTEEGTFVTAIEAHAGLNLVQAVDPDNSLDTVFLFGDFASPSKPIPAAVTVRINALGFKSLDSKNVTLSRLSQLALDDVDLLAAMKGQTFTGEFTGGSWSYKVSGTSYDGATVSFTPRTGGASFAAGVDNVKVNGTLQVKVLFTKTDAATIGLESVGVKGNLDASLAASGALTAKGSSVTTTLEGFSYDSNNAGFPCCVDWILTQVMQSKVEEAVRDKIRATLESKVSFALNQLGLPGSFDLSSTGFPAKIDVKQRFDAATFTGDGTSLSVQVHFSGKVEPGDPGDGAPGWLQLGAKPLSLAGSSPFGMSVALDAVNQALYAAWAQGGLARTVPDVPTVGDVALDPKLPPVVRLTPEGKLLAEVGEIEVTAKLGQNPIRAALTVIDEVTPTLDPKGGKLLLAPSEQPTVSVTWLEVDGVAPALLTVIKSMILEQVPSFLSPIALPLPSIPLAGLAPSQANLAAAIGPTAKLSVDTKANRAAIQGALVLVPVK